MKKVVQEYLSWLRTNGLINLVQEELAAKAWEDATNPEPCCEDDWEEDWDD